MAKRSVIYLLEEIRINNIAPKVCNCKRQLCHGKFIPSRIGQTECIFAIREKERELELSTGKVLHNNIIMIQYSQVRDNLKSMNKINFENYNEFERDYIIEKFDSTRVTYDDTNMALMDVAKAEECKVDAQGNVYYPCMWNIGKRGDDNFGVVDYELLCTKQEMLSMWIKEQHLA